VVVGPAGDEIKPATGESGGEALAFADDLSGVAGESGRRAVLRVRQRSLRSCCCAVHPEGREDGRLDRGRVVWLRTSWIAPRGPRNVLCVVVEHFGVPDGEA